MTPTGGAINRMFRGLAAVVLTTAVAMPAPAVAEMLQVRGVRYWTGPKSTRVVVEVSGDFTYHSERLHAPERIFFDIYKSRPVLESRQNLNRDLTDQWLKKIRVAETLPGVTRVVLDLQGTSETAVTQLSNPYRLVIELRDKGTVRSPAGAEPEPGMPPTEAAPPATKPAQKTAAKPPEKTTPQNRSDSKASVTKPPSTAPVRPPTRVEIAADPLRASIDGLGASAAAAANLAKQQSAPESKPAVTAKPPANAAPSAASPQPVPVKRGPAESIATTKPPAGSATTSDTTGPQQTLVKRGPAETAATAKPPANAAPSAASPQPVPVKRGPAETVATTKPPAGSATTSDTSGPQHTLVKRGPAEPLAITKPPANSAPAVNATGPQQTLVKRGPAESATTKQPSSTSAPDSTVPHQIRADGIPTESGATPKQPAGATTSDTSAAHQITARGTPTASSTPVPPASESGAALSKPGATAPETIASAKPPATTVRTPAGPTEPGKAARRTSDGQNSLIRALGLKITRVVLDPGHGGHDQGTVGGKGLLEKDLVLDVALRLGKLIEDRMGAEVIYTRHDDTFVPLEGRTALANERKADLFLSIHANSSPLTRIAGVETFYLNFTGSKDALDVASRENASSQKSIFELRDIIQKIAVQDKAEESKEFAGRMQASLFAFSARSVPGAAVRNRGVKRAPFVVLIGAHMPSVLAEIGFLSNAREEALLKKPDYRQKLAEALLRGLQKYAESLSHFQVAAANDEGR